MAKKPKIHKDIKEAGQALADLMREKLTVIADDMVKQVTNKAKRLTPSQKLQALNGLAPRGVQDYKAAVKSALAVIALDAIAQARKEVPKKKNVRLTEVPEGEEATLQLDEFDKLPPAIQKKIKTRTDLLVGKQVGDLQKVIEFAYSQAEEETDSDDQILSDLNDSAIGWLDGTALEAGASLNAASVINNARQAFFFDDSVTEEIEAFEFVNGDPVTEICQDLAGTVFSKDDPGADQYQPPLHWNCKSYIVPILLGNLGTRDIEKLQPSTKELEDQIQFHETHTCKNHS